MNYTLSKFRLELERSLHISDWSPTESDLAYIARKITLSGANSRTEITQIVLQVCPKTRWVFLDGVDNSDLSTLIQLATLSAASK